MGERGLRILAWVGLIVVVGWGFFLQQVTIDELKQTQLKLAATQVQLRHLVDDARTQRKQDLGQLCVVLLDVTNDDAIVSTAFANMGISCPSEGG